MINFDEISEHLILMYKLRTHTFTYRMTKKKRNNNSTKDAINQAIYKIKGVSFQLTLTTQLIKPNYPIYKTSEMLRATRLVKNLSFRPIENQNILRFVLSLFYK